MHIEITHSLDSDFFIHALRAVSVHIGNVKVLYTDNGTKVVGCATENHAICQNND